MHSSHGPPGSTGNPLPNVIPRLPSAAAVGRTCRVGEHSTAVHIALSQGVVIVVSRDRDSMRSGRSSPVQPFPSSSSSSMSSLHGSPRCVSGPSLEVESRSLVRVYPVSSLCCPSASRTAFCISPWNRSFLAVECSPSPASCPAAAGCTLEPPGASDPFPARPRSRRTRARRPATSHFKFTPATPPCLLFLAHGLVSLNAVAPPGPT